GLYLIGYFCNFFMPSYLGGDVVRSLHLGKRAGQHRAAVATVLERFSGLVAMIALGFLFMWGSLVPWWVRIAIVGVAAGLATGTYVALHPRLIRLLQGWRFTKGFSTHAERFQAATKFAISQPTLMVKAFALSFLFHTLTVANVVACG